MKIDFVSDVSCPWCAIGLNALEQAMAADKRILVVGGGFSGTLLAINLLRHDGPRATLIERRVQEVPLEIFAGLGANITDSQQHSSDPSGGTLAYVATNTPPC